MIESVWMERKDGEELGLIFASIEVEEKAELLAKELHDFELRYLTNH